MDLEVEGRHVLLFDDDATAAFVGSREALVPWNDDGSLLIDRYDVRHLLDRIPTRPTRRAQPGCSPPSRLEEPGGVSQSELDLERYLDLPPPNEGDSGSETIKRSEATGGAYQAVPFSYGNTNSMADLKYSDSGSNSSAFHPPFPVPENLLSNLPPTEKLHQIIARTAIFVSEHGGQSEIVLRVKQGDNPTFGFLMPDHHLHAYFRYLVDHPQLSKANTNSSTTQDKKSNDQENEAHIAAVGALSLLGSVYGSGDDDDAAVQVDFNEMKPSKSNITGNAVVPHRSEQGGSSISTVSEDKETIKHFVAVKENIFGSKRNHIVNAGSCSAADSKKARDGHGSPHGALHRTHRTRSSQSDIKPLILEPPSSLKGTIDKVVEFILRNGKELEAILIAQDKKTGRFPFLLPSNQYHAYYLKILDEARESKLFGKNLSDQKHDAQSHVGSKKKKQESPNKGSSVYDSNFTEQSEGWSYDLQRKEKFKMIIGGPKKDTHDQRPTPARKSGASADEAAAIVLAATRGLSPANADQRPTPARQSGVSADEAAAIVQAATGGSNPANADQLPTRARQSGVSADEAAAIVLAATRGLSPVNALKNMSMDELDTGRTRVDSGRASSIGSFSSLQGHIPVLKSLKGEAGISLPVDLSGSTGQRDKDSSSPTGDVMVAKAIAETVALVASNEADSSEAYLTKEQKLKAERLKRAKMFAAMIKSGGHAITELMHSASVPNGSLEVSTAGSNRSGAESDVVGKEREGSSVPFVAEISERTKSQEIHSIYDHNREHRSRKKHLSRSRDHVDGLEEDHDHSRKKHRSEHSSHHSRDHHKHRKNHSSSKDKESRHYHKHHSSSEDEHRHRKSSRSRHRYTNIDFSENEDEERKMSDRHRRKHHSHSEKQREIEGECKAMTLDHLDVSLNSYNHGEEVGMPAVSDAQPSDDATEVPSELRAKIRAMLLETM